MYVHVRYKCLNVFQLLIIGTPVFAFHLCLMPLNILGDMRDDYVQGVLTNGMLYRTEIPSNVNHFVCQLHGL